MDVSEQTSWRPILKPWLRTARTEAWLALEHGRNAVVFEGSDVQTFLPRLLGLLDGTRTTYELANALSSPEAAVRAALTLLDQHGLLLAEAFPDDGDGDDTLIRFLSAVRGEPAPGALASRLRRVSAGVVGTSGVAKRLRSYLASFGVRDRAGAFDEPRARDLTLVAPSGAEVPELAAWNHAALRERSSWLLVLPFDGAMAAVGPLFLPTETACFECFEIRRGSNLEYAVEYATLVRVPPRCPQPEPIVEASAALAILQALRWLVWKDPSLPGLLTALELSPLRTTEHRLLRVPRCPSCSELSRRSAPAPWFEAETARP